MSRERLIPALVVASTLGIGLLVLQRWVAETKFAAIVLVGAWFGIVALGALAAVRRDPGLRLPVLGTYAAILVATVAIGYWTGFRDTEVNEDVVVAAAEASPEEQDAGLAGASLAEPQVEAKGSGAKPKEEGPKKAGDESKPANKADDGSPAAEEPPAPSATPEAEAKPDEPAEPVSLASGQFRGEDGHSGRGTATVVEEENGNRTLTFTDFDVDPGAKTVVWLTPGETEYEDRVELGTLKGNVGDQQYTIPDDADLRKYDTVILYCTPFTVRIAVAPLG